MSQVVDKAIEQVTDSLTYDARTKLVSSRFAIESTDAFRMLSKEDQRMFGELFVKISENIPTQCRAEAEKKVYESILKLIDI